ncbi:MAG: putative DNA binding domain-containing protein [Chloroflexi bacterium]|nr:putative DNA binding domain-containing protein [Chloroflexota bacterium]
MPAAALEAGVDALHLGREIEDHLRGLGRVLVGDLLASGYLAPTAWGALGPWAGRAASEVLRQLAGHCLAGDVDWRGFWIARGITIVPDAVKAGVPGITQLVTAVPAIVQAALADDRRKGADPAREWVVIDSRKGLVSQPKTLEELGPGILGVTREAVRLIEAKAMRRIGDAWARGFHGVTYRLEPELEPLFASLKETLAAVDGPLPEERLLERLDIGQSQKGRDYRLVAFVLELGGMVRFDADADRRPVMWAPATDHDARARIALADRIGRYLTEENAGALSSADIVLALNKAGGGKRVTIAEVERAVTLTPLVEHREDGRWQGRFEFLLRRGDQAFRIISAAGGPVELAEVVRLINARNRHKPVEIRNLSNHLAGDDRFVAIGKSGQWGLADRDADAAVNIVVLMMEVLRRAGHPLAAAEIDAAVRERRTVGKNSVTMYLEMRSEFVKLPDKGWALVEWPEARRAKVADQSAGPAEQARTAAIKYLKERGGEAVMDELAGALAERLRTYPSRVSAIVRRHASFEVFTRDGRSVIRLVSEDPRPRRAPRKESLADRMGALLIPYLTDAPGGERELADVVRYVTTKMGVIPATVYGYVRRIPGVVRIDEGDRKLVRLARVPVDSGAATWPEPATEARVRAIMAAGEKPNIEFKSTLRWNVKANLDTPDLLNKMVTKTIAAFANTLGGTLLIGVDPVGRVCGVELDTKVMQKPGESVIDCFSQYLAVVMKSQLGLEESAHVATQYVELDGGTVCLVDVPPGYGPVYLTTKELVKEQAREVTEFYVRNGTTSEALPLPKIADYINRHWK